MVLKLPCVEKLLQPRVRITEQSKMPLIDRIMTRIVLDPGSGCWLWEGALTVGYGCLKPLVDEPKRTDLVHRLTYEYFIGPIPDGLEPDHLCRVRSCCNPWHLEPVTRRENAIRGECGSVTRAKMLAKTHCPQGHPYSGDNLYIAKSGDRMCKTCQRTRDKARKAALRKNAASETGVADSIIPISPNN